MSGFIDKDRYFEEVCEEESGSSSEAFDFPQICFRSYSSLDELSCSDVNEEECRLVKLNNTIKKLSDVINDPLKRENSSAVCCLLCKCLKYNNNDGFYVNFLPQIDEILEFLSMRSKSLDEYLFYLYDFLALCSKPLLLQRSSEILSSASKLQRHFSLLGYLLALVPTREGFLLVKEAVERLAGGEAWSRREAVKPDALREAMEASRLPVTLAELARVASPETYPDVLQMLLIVVSTSNLCCFKVLEVGIENELLIKMHPAYECHFKFSPITDDTDLQLDKEDYYKSLERSTEILWRLMTSIILSPKLPESVLNLKSPTKAAMWSLRAAFRREVLRARVSQHSRRLRNDLTNLILASLIGRGACAPWELHASGLAEDLADLVVATELGVEALWARRAILESSRDTGLTFKKMLLLCVAMMAEEIPEAAHIIKGKKIVSGILHLVNPNFEPWKTVWSSEQLWHLFKYASNTLTYLAPKVPEEFIECNGSVRILAVLELFLKTNFNCQYIVLFAEMICCLSSSNCELLLDDFRKFCGFVPGLLQVTHQLVQFETWTTNDQKIMSFLLLAVENIMDNQRKLQECNAEFVVKTAIDILIRCLSQTEEDSELEQSFLVAIGTFIWKCLVDCPEALDNFLAEGGLYHMLDLIAQATLPVQNLYLGVITDICENQCCSHYLLSWRAPDKTTSFVAFLANIWREEEKLFGVERTPEGCIANLQEPLKNDDNWLYLCFTKSIRNTHVVITTAVGPVRPKIYYLRQLIKHDVDLEESTDICNCCYCEVIGGLNTEDRITMLTIDSYEHLRRDEAGLEVTALASLMKLRPLRKRGESLGELWKKSSGRGERVRQLQMRLLEARRVQALQEERATLRSIRDSKLSPAFDALAELAFVGRTSAREYLLAKCAEIGEKVAEGRQADTAEPFYRTLNAGVNVTNVFNQRLQIRSIPKLKESLTCPVSELSTPRSELSKDTSFISLPSHKSDTSLLLKKYRTDEKGNVYVAKKKK